MTVEKATSSPLAVSPSLFNFVVRWTALVKGLGIWFSLLDASVMMLFNWDAAFVCAHCSWWLVRPVRWCEMFCTIEHATASVTMKWWYVICASLFWLSSVVWMFYFTMLLLRVSQDDMLFERLSVVTECGLSYCMDCRDDSSRSSKLCGLVIIPLLTQNPIYFLFLGLWITAQKVLHRLAKPRLQLVSQSALVAPAWGCGYLVEATHW